MAYSRDQILQTHTDFKENINHWQFFIRSYNGGFDYLNRYNLELDNEFNQRLLNTPCDNHCKNIIQIYSSFLFRVKASRDFGAMQDEASLSTFLRDTDLEGNNFSSVMKQAQNYSAIYGHCLLILDKPKIQTNTKAEELNQDIRPYLSILTPENIFDWNYKRLPNGKYVLDYLKVREEVDSKGGTYFRCWHEDVVDTVYLEANRNEPILIDTAINQIGKIPAVILYNAKSHKKALVNLI